MLIRFSLSVLSASLVCIGLTQAACIPNDPLTRPDSRYEAVDDKGAQVKDLDTGLVWQRCVHGQQWDGKTC
nr:hypothetical protein [Limnohabitans sp.]